MGSSVSALVEISTDDTELDLSGVVLDGEGSDGYGIRVHDCQRITVKNGLIRGFHYGVSASDVTGLRIENCVISGNHNPWEAGWLSDTHEPAKEGFGGGVYLYRVYDCHLEGNQFNNNFDGVLLVESERNFLLRNDASYNSNVGIHLIQSSHNTIQENRADHCIRYTGRFWCDTADSAEILLEEYSHHNRIVGNCLRHSGDGLFIRANNLHGCNHNFVGGNDGSFSPNNAFEVDFSEHNVLENNVANFSNYGFWLGHCRATEVRENQVKSNRFDGIAVVNGSDITIRGNRLRANLNGIRLWREQTADGLEANDASAKSIILSNQISDSRGHGVLYSDTDEVHLEGNICRGNAED